MQLEDWVAETPPLSHADAARTLLEMTSNGVLATLESDGHPYASIVELMPLDNDIVLFLSDLAAHTRNAKTDDRVSVVIREEGGGERLALGRATFQGVIERMERDDDLEQSWVERHPGAANYIGFSDFSFYRVSVQRVRYIAGFGRMGWVDVDNWSDAKADPLCHMAADVIEHMNDDHAHNLLDYAHAIAGEEWATSAVMTGLDSRGFDMRLTDGERVEATRIGFAKPKTTRDEIHETMVRLARLARQPT